VRRAIERQLPRRLTAAAGLACGILAAALQAAGDQVRAEIYLDPPVIGVGEVAQLEIKISVEGGSVPNIPDPVFELDNLRQVEEPKQSTGLTTIGGRRLASRTLKWTLAPKKLGRARVHSASVTIAGRRIALEDRRIDVVRDPPPGRRSSRSEDPFDRIFDGQVDEDSEASGRPWRRPRRRSELSVPKIHLRAEISPPSPGVGQQTLYTLNLYTQVDIDAVNPEEFPDFKGFWAQVIPQPDQQPEMVTFEGESYGRVVLIQRALFPRRAGTFDIEPIAARMQAEIPDPGSHLPKPREIVRRSNGVRVRVRELPPAPAGFQGAVGSIELAARLTPQELEVGEAATLELELRGQAHLQGVQAPRLPEIPGVRVFQPQQRGDGSLRGKTVYSSRTWSFVLVPERPGEWEVPRIEIPYFDPRQGRYQVASSAPLALVVGETTHAARPASERLEVHTIRSSALPASEPVRDLSGLLPWLFGLPWAVTAALFLVRLRGEIAGARPARRHLHSRLEKAAAEERPRQAAAEIEEAWREFLFERWRIPRSTPSPQWGELLTGHGVARETADALVKLADDLHYLRYAPKLASVAELREELLERSRKLARNVG
jgi:hypothetical protein